MPTLKASIFVLLFFLYAYSEAEPAIAAPPELSLNQRAEQGDPYAQVFLGLKYAEGEGVPQDHREAVKWFRFAAEQGDPNAQYSLGLLYAGGLGVPQNYKEAYALLNISADQGHEKAIEQRDIVAGKLDTEAVLEAQSLARTYYDKYNN